MQYKHCFVPGTRYQATGPLLKHKCSAEPTFMHLKFYIYETADLHLWSAELRTGRPVRSSALHKCRFWSESYSYLNTCNSFIIPIVANLLRQHLNILKIVQCVPRVTTASIIEDDESYWYLAIENQKAIDCDLHWGSRGRMITMICSWWASDFFACSLRRKSEELSKREQNRRIAV